MANTYNRYTLDIFLNEISPKETQKMKVNTPVYNKRLDSDEKKCINNQTDLTQMSLITNKLGEFGNKTSFNKP